MKLLQKANIDFLIIGGGPAGISAAIQASRLGLKAVIIEKNRLGGQANAAPWIENYPGFSDGIAGSDLMDSFTKQLRKWNAEIIYDVVVDIEKNAKNFIVCTSLRRYESRSVLLALGLLPKLLGIKREIPYADPFVTEHRNKSVVVIGGGDAAFDLATAFAKKARSVRIVMRSEKPRALPRLVERAVESGVRIETDHTISDIKADIVVSCIGKEPCHPLLEKLFDKFGVFELKPGMAPNIPGLFLAGDLCRGDDRHIAIAAGDGLTATQLVSRHLNL